MAKLEAVSFLRMDDFGSEWAQKAHNRNELQQKLASIIESRPCDVLIIDFNACLPIAVSVEDADADYVVGLLNRLDNDGEEILSPVDSAKSEAAVCLMGRNLEEFDLLISLKNRTAKSFMVLGHREVEAILTGIDYEMSAFDNVESAFAKAKSVMSYYRHVSSLCEELVEKYGEIEEARQEEG